MNQQKDRMAGWLAVLAGVALIPEVLLLLGFDTGRLNSLNVLAAGALILGLRIAFTAYALLRFRASLRRSIDFHGLDSLIPGMIVASIVLGIAVIWWSLFTILTPPAAWGGDCPPRWAPSVPCRIDR